MSSLHRSIRATLARTAFAALALAATVAACDDPLGPDVDPQAVPFYYYENDKVYLRVDGTRLTAVPQAEGDTATFRAVLAQAGVAVDSIRPMWVPEGHWFIHLPRDTSPRRAEAAARQLRLDGDIRFASAVYTVPGSDDCPLYMVNRLIVQFRPGADEGAIRALNAATGVRGEQVQPWGTRAYEYPARMAATPLEVAAHYHRQRIVDWADADRVSGCLRLNARGVR